jgi:hypothetical protein
MPRHFKPVKELIAQKQQPPIPPSALKRVMDVMRMKKFDLEDDVEKADK